MLQTAVLSFIFIFCIHYLILFFQKMLTIRKEKDLLHSSIEKYQTMYKQISTTTTTTTPIQTQPSPPQPQAQPLEMKNELKEYMLNHLHAVV